MDIEASADDVASAREDSVRMVGDAAAGLLKGDRQRARGLRFVTPEFSRERWSEMAELGWLMLRLPEARGGLGMGLSEHCAIARIMGAELSPEPLPSAALVAAVLPEDAAARVLACEDIVLPAFAGYETNAPALRDGRLTGSPEPLPGAAAAQAFLVQTRDGAALVRADAPGVKLENRAAQDGGTLGYLTFEAASAEARQIDMDSLRDEAAILLSAQLLGLSEAAFEITTTYVKDRKQFGVAIGSFQALQHRMVDLLLELSLMRAAIEAAAGGVDDGARGRPAALQASLAKARATRAARAITQAAIQLHGGIGYTDEADIGLYLRKAMTLTGLLGSEHFHRRRALSLKGDEA